MGICPGYVSNMTSAKCIGNFQYNSSEAIYFLGFALVFLYGCAWAYIIIKKGMKKDANVGEQE